MKNALIVAILCISSIGFADSTFYKKEDLGKKVTLDVLKRGQTLDSSLHSAFDGTMDYSLGIYKEGSISYYLNIPGANSWTREFLEKTADRLTALNEVKDYTNCASGLFKLVGNVEEVLIVRGAYVVNPDTVDIECMK